MAQKPLGIQAMESLKGNKSSGNQIDHSQNQSDKRTERQTDSGVTRGECVDDGSALQNTARIKHSPQYSRQSE